MEINKIAKELINKSNETKVVGDATSIVHDNIVPLKHSFADQIYKKENFNIEKFSQLKPISKFKSIYDNYPSYGLVNNQFRNDGFITLFKESFEKEIEQDNLNLITSSSTNSLKKFISLLDIYKEWINLFRKMHEEC